MDSILQDVSRSDFARDTLIEITQLLQQKAPELKKSVERTESLRRSRPSLRVATSIFSQEDRMSLCSAADSINASSELEFDFDDIIVNSAAYRRVLAVARHRAVAAEPEPRAIPEGDLIEFSDDDTVRQIPAQGPIEGIMPISEDILGLRFSTDVRIIRCQLSELKLSAIVLNQA